MTHNTETTPTPSLNFIEQIIEHDLQTNKYNQRVHTRFPPEPNGYLHIGHAKSICLNFGLGLKYNGKTNLRFDDTNPSTEDTEYVNAIQEDIKWLGFEWNEKTLYASDYYEQMYNFALFLIKKNKAYVDDSSQEEIAKMRGIPTMPGTLSPYRNRTIAENINLFERMKNGEFADGTKVLRAKIDMASPNMHLRDPILYRIKHQYHHRTHNHWCIYPMYDFAHCISDSIEGITHSICTLEFEVHRPLYDWLLIELELYRPQQIEFARLNLSYTVMSKRKLLQLVQNNYVTGWNDPRMLTISGLRRRGYTPEAIRNFAATIGVARREHVIEMELLEHCIREDLNKKATRVMVVLNPIKLIITNYPHNTSEMLNSENNPEDPSQGTREIPFTNELYIEQDDFMINPPKKYFRLAPGSEVRLKSAYIIKCTNYITNHQGNVTEIHAIYYPESKSGSDTTGKKVQGTIHWVSAKHAIPIEARLYDRLFIHENPAELDDFLQALNPNSLQVIPAYAEPYLKNANLNNRYQFIRKGYFCLDQDSNNNLIFNQTVTLKDSWKKSQQ